MTTTELPKRVSTPWGDYTDHPIVRRALRLHAFQTKAGAAVRGLREMTLSRTEAAETLAAALALLEPDDLPDATVARIRGYGDILAGNLPLVSPTAPNGGALAELASLPILVNESIPQSLILAEATRASKDSSLPPLYRWDQRPVSREVPYGLGIVL